MRMYFKQRLFSWFDSYDIFDEEGNTLYVVKGQLSWCIGKEFTYFKRRVFC